MNEIVLNPLPGLSVYGCWYGSSAATADKPVVVLLHEGLGCTAMWKDFPLLLHEATGLSVFSYDRPGYGRSGALPGGFCEGFLEREADLHLPAILKEAGIAGPILLVGHSDGATAALMAAANHDLRVEGVVSMAPHVIIEEISVAGLLLTRNMASSTDFLAKLSRYHGERTEQLVSGWLNAWLSPWARHWQMDHYLIGIQCPVLFLQGVDDHFGTEAQAHHLRSKAASAVRVVMIPGCGHVPYLQAKEEVLGEILAFFVQMGRV